VRSIYADWERGDFGRADWADPEIVYVIAEDPLPATWKGLSEIAKGVRDFLSAWEGYRMEAEAITAE